MAESVHLDRLKGCKSEGDAVSSVPPIVPKREVAEPDAKSFTERLLQAKKRASRDL